MCSTGATLKLYKSVMDEVINEVRESFLDEGVDEQVLEELKLLWESKLKNSKAVDSSSSERGRYGLGAAEGCSTSTTSTTSRAGKLSSTSLLAIPADPNALVPIQVTIAGSDQKITILVPVFCIKADKLQEILSFPAIEATLALPAELAAKVLQGQVNQALQNLTLDSNASPTGSANHSGFGFGQVDGQAQATGSDSSSENEDDEDEDADDDDDGDIESVAEEDKEEPNPEQDQNEEPLNSGDDISDGEDSDALFDKTENIIVCQFDKGPNRARNKWKFFLMDGVMNLNGKEYVFKKATGDAVW